MAKSKKQQQEENKKALDQTQKAPSSRLAESIARAMNDTDKAQTIPTSTLQEQMNYYMRMQQDRMAYASVQPRPPQRPKYNRGQIVAVEGDSRKWSITGVRASQSAQTLGTVFTYDLENMDRADEAPSGVPENRLILLTQDTNGQWVPAPRVSNVSGQLGSMQGSRIVWTEGVSSAISFPMGEEKPKAKPKPKPKPKKIPFESVIMPEENRQQIVEAIEQINQHDLIFKDWGFGSTIEKGKGVSMLFYGEPGTGKTLVCQSIAEMLEKKLLTISTADIESSAPGEAERNIRKYFKEATENKSVLLFDECDSLIFTRKNAGPILGAQINELLTNIEKFDGLTLFTTNRLGTLDEAVNRRLALKLHFAMPNVEQRAKIWERMIPKKAPLHEDVDFEKLAQIEITGGYIKNAVLRAARMAATEKVDKKDKKIKMEHLKKALIYETESMIEFDDARSGYERGIGKVVNNNGVMIGQQSSQQQIQKAIDNV